MARLINSNGTRDTVSNLTSPIHALRSQKIPECPTKSYKRYMIEELELTKTILLLFG